MERPVNELFGLGRRKRRQNAKRFLLDLEVNRTVAGQLAIELQGNVLLARYAQAASLEIFNLGDTNLGAEYNILEILDDFEIAEPFEHNQDSLADRNCALTRGWFP